MLKIWSFAFQAEPTDALTDVPAQSPGWPMLGMLLLILALGVTAGPVQRYSAAAAAAIVDPSGYSEAVLGGASSPVRVEEP